jgi:hypothetical protein
MCGTRRQGRRTRRCRCEPPRSPPRSQCSPRPARRAGPPIATSALGPGSRCCHICAGTGPSPASSAPGLSSPCPPPGMPHCGACLGLQTLPSFTWVCGSSTGENSKCLVCQARCSVRRGATARRNRLCCVAMRRNDLCCVAMGAPHVRHSSLQCAVCALLCCHACSVRHRCAKRTAASHPCTAQYIYIPSATGA